MNHKWLDILSKNGYRLTDSRKAVVEIISLSTHALTPIEIYEKAKAKRDDIGLVSVYRTLEKLEELKLIQRVHQPASCQAFMVASQEHQHLLLCSTCGEIQFFDGDDLETLIATISKKTGFKISEHWLQLFGQCANCQKTQS